MAACSSDVSATGPSSAPARLSTTRAIFVLEIGRQNPGAIHGQLEKLCHEDHRWAIASLRVARQRRLTKPHTDGTSRAPSSVLTTVPTMKGSTPPVQAASAPMR